MRKTEETCSKYAGSIRFNVIPKEGKLAIPIKSYKDQFCEHIIINRMWGVFSITEPQNKEKEWDLLLHHSKFPLESVKGFVQSLLKGSEAYQYIVQNLTWSGVYLRSTFSNDLLQKGLTLVPDSNRTLGLCRHHDYYNLQFLLLFCGYSEPREESKTQRSSG